MKKSPITIFDPNPYYLIGSLFLVTGYTWYSWCSTSSNPQTVDLLPWILLQKQDTWGSKVPFPTRSTECVLSNRGTAEIHSFLRCSLWKEQYVNGYVNHSMDTFINLKNASKIFRNGKISHLQKTNLDLYNHCPKNVIKWSKHTFVQYFCQGPISALNPSETEWG